MARHKKLIDPDLFVRRLNEAMTRKGLTQEDLAAAIEAHLGARPGQSTISNWTRGEKTPRHKYLPALVQVLDLSWDELGVAPAPTNATLAQPRGAPALTDRGDGEGSIDTPDLRHIVLIPRVGHVSAGAGYAADAAEAEGFDAYSRGEIARLTSTDPARLRSMKVVGDSMEPEIRANDTVVYEPCSAVSDFGIYVLQMDDLALVKKVQRFGGGVLEIIPANKAYRNEMLVPLSEADTPNMYRSEVSGQACAVAVLGKVVFYLRPA